jgi:ribonuclease-3
LNTDHDALQERLGYRFSQAGLLQRALTHRSFGADHNERLEFLGDAVLNLAVSDLLFEHLADSPEGELTRVRAHLVRQEMLHALAVAIQLPSSLRLSDGEARGGGAQRPSILADALEAIIGGVYVDGGYEAARQLVRRLFSPVIAETAMQAWAKDPKTQLQEWLQARRHNVPEYRIDSTRGRAHDQVFFVVCSVPALGVEGRGEGRSRRAAEQEAAREALAQLVARDTGRP